MCEGTGWSERHSEPKHSRLSGKDVTCTVYPSLASKLELRVALAVTVDGWPRPHSTAGTEPAGSTP